MANVRLNEEERKDIGRLLCDYVESGLNSLGNAPVWWEECERSYYNAVGTRIGGDQGNDNPGYDVFHIPLSQPRQDALTAQVCTVLAKQDPIMLDTSSDGPVADAKEQIVQRLWRDAKFSKKVRRAVRIATNTDLSFLRLCPKGDTGSLEMAVIHPRDMVVFPALPGGIEEATCVGHRIPKPRRHVLQMRDLGFYYDDGKMPTQGYAYGETGDVERDRSGVIVDDAGPQADLDVTVELWDLTVRLDLSQLKRSGKDWTGKKERLYRATVARDDRTLLALEEYPFSEPWYFEVRLIGSDGFYPATSVARNLLPSQQTYSNLWSGFYNVAMIAAQPAVFGPAPENGEKFTSYGFAQFVKSDSQASAYFSPSSKAELSQFPVMIANVERVADKVARISQNTTGGDAPDQTATEASIVASGVAVGLEEYIEEASSDFARMAKLTLEFVASDPEPYAQSIGIVPPAPPMPAVPMMPPMGGMVA